MKAGAPKPDISTPEALKQTLLAAKSIAYSEPSAGGASGVYFAKLLERMGIAEAMKPKTKYPPAGGFSAALLMTGEAELAVQQKPELLHVAGTEIVGFLPGDLNMVTEFAAGIMAGSKNAEAAKALIKMLRTPEAKAAFRAKGLDPRDSVEAQTYWAMPLTNDQFSFLTSTEIDEDVLFDAAPGIFREQRRNAGEERLLLLDRASSHLP